MAIFEVFQELFRPSSDDPSSKNALLDDERCVEIICEDGLPSIEAVASFSPTSITSSSCTIAFLEDEVYDNILTGKKETSTHHADEMTKLPKATDNESEKVLSSSSPPSNYQASDYYISENDLDLLLLPPESLEEYEKLVHDEQKEKHAERQLRRTLIKEELDFLIKTTVDNDEMQEQEFEPEAVEALGIAANRVAYLKKYYDVARCEYIYVPSVAYTIMNGSLLEEASKHYFGKSDEFLVAYAAGLGSTIIVQHGHLSLNQEENALTEDLDLSVDMDDDSYADLEDDKIAKFVWGVSPKASPAGNIPMGSRFNDWERSGDKEMQKTRSRFFLKSCVAILCLLSACFGYFFLKLDLKLTSNKVTFLYSEGRDSVKTVLSDLRGFQSELKFVFQDVSNPQHRGGDLDNASSSCEKAPEEEIISEDLSVLSPLNSQLYVCEGEAAVSNQKEVKKMKRPIASNLLYYSE
jgi:hypothetical protein